MNATVTDDKPLAINIAAYITMFPMLEAGIQLIFERAVGGDGTWSDCILHHVQSISTRIDIVEDFTKNCCRDKQFAAAVIPLFPRMRQANTYRNHLAHGLFITDQGKARVASNMFARKKTFRQEDIDASAVLQRFHELEQLYLDLLHAVDALPPYFPREMKR
ncbi:MAG: hypothetical protein KL840_18330 [Aquamicrobium sp.]|nr:hypothetical protein [Aquamicrobium sp.]